MILKQPALDNISAGLNPVARILPVLAVDNIGSTLQELGARATQFAVGREYVAHVLSKVGDTAYTVQVQGTDSNGKDIKGAILRMDLGSTAQAGQTLLLRYMKDSPVPTFLQLSDLASNSAGSKTELSSAATLISQSLKQAEGDGIATRYQATAVVTNHPQNPQVIAHDLKQAINNSGLFYESHLSEVVQGTRAMSTVLQEPQNQLNQGLLNQNQLNANQANSPITALMAQQLAVLENQRLSWQGQVWPGQNMSWDVYLQQRESERESSSSYQPSPDEPRPIASDLTLHLPHLGKVTAKLSLVDGHMRINIQAEQAQTLEELKAKRQALAQALLGNGQQLDALTVSQAEGATS